MMSSYIFLHPFPAFPRNPLAIFPGSRKAFCLPWDFEVSSFEAHQNWFWCLYQYHPYIVFSSVVGMRSMHSLPLPPETLRALRNPFTLTASVTLGRIHAAASCALASVKRNPENVPLQLLLVPTCSGGEPVPPQCLSYSWTSIFFSTYL